MNELRSILNAWRQNGPHHDQAVLATVVHVTGSAYRRPGARMLILPDGRRFGTISGGCLEGDVVRKASWWTSDQGTALRVFDNSSEDAAWEFGLGCNGVITVLLERLALAQVTEMLAFLDQRQASRRSAVVATVIRSSDTSRAAPGDRLLCDPDRAAGGTLMASPLEKQLAPDIAAAFRNSASRFVHLPSADVFVEWIGTPQRLVVFGAGHDVIPLATIAHLLGWSVTIADRPSAYIQPHRFPGADKVVALPATGGIDPVEIDHDTAVVVMSHNFPMDAAVLPHILSRNPRYLGLLGPRRRAEKLFKEIHKSIDDWDVHAPVGLDIGSDHPETVALSIIAEIQSVLTGRPSGSLRLRNGPIHSPPDEWGRPEPTRRHPPEETIQASCSLDLHLHHA